MNKIKIGLMIILIAIILLGTLYLYSIKKNEECTNNPFIFGARKIKESDNVEVMCSCQLVGNELYAPFYFNRTYMGIKPLIG